MLCTFPVFTLTPTNLQCPRSRIVHLYRCRIRRPSQVLGVNLNVGLHHVRWNRIESESIIQIPHAHMH